MPTPTLDSQKQHVRDLTEAIPASAITTDVIAALGDVAYDRGYISKAIEQTVNELLTMHADTGLDVSDLAGVVGLIRLVYPDFTPIPDGQRSYTVKSIEYRRQRYGLSGKGMYRSPIGRDTFTGADEWTPERKR